MAQDKPEAKGHRWFAAAYDRMSRSQERGRVGEMRRELLRDLRGDVLEIGAGTGANFEHYLPGARVVAVEPDVYMLRKARRRLRNLPEARIDLRQAPAEALPFTDASFDVVVSTLVLCSVGDLPAALTEMRRVLRAGGELRFMEHVRGGGMLGRTQDLIRPAWSWCLAGCHPNRRTEGALLDAGFEFTTIQRPKIEPWMPAIVGTARVGRRGTPGPRVVIASTSAQRDDAFSVRVAVFVDEQGISRDDELDELDATATHCVAYDGDRPVAAGRLVMADRYAKIGRMAVLPSHRGRGIGALVLDALEREGVARGVSEFHLSAQLSARGFYDRAGYTPVGDVYDEVAIPHIAMVKDMPLRG